MHFEAISKKEFSGPIRIATVDDHKIFAESLARILDEVDGFKVVGCINRPVELIPLLIAQKPDILLLDLCLPHVEMGLQLCREIPIQFPKIRIIILSMTVDPEIVRLVSEEHIYGFVHKNNGINELSHAIHEAMKGLRYISLEVQKALSEVPRQTIVNGQTLTKREKQVLKLILEEYKTQEIAEKLFISKYTVESHRSNIFLKLGVRNMAGLARKVYGNDDLMT